MEVVSKVMTKQEVAEILGGISSVTVERLVKKGLLACRKIGARTFFTAQDVADYLEKTKTSTLSRHGK